MDPVQEWPAALAPDRRALLTAVRDVVVQALPPGYEEHLAHGMPTWSVPLERLPDTYDGEPLGYVALASQARHASLQLMGLYGDVEERLDLRRRWEAGGRRLDMGRACLRFRRLEDLDLDPVREAVASTAVDEYVALYRRSRAR